MFYIFILLEEQKNDVFAERLMKNLKTMGIGFSINQSEVTT